MQKHKHDIAAIRDLLRNAFTADGLRRFCHDKPAFRRFLAHFGPGSSLIQTVDAFIEQSAKQAPFRDLIKPVFRTLQVNNMDKSNRELTKFFFGINAALLALVLEIVKDDFKRLILAQHL
jgi:hypothetical protein